MRTRNSIFNMLSVALSFTLRLVLAFAVKTVFIRILGEEYNGLDGLFSSIISMLAIAELGIGSVITYNLYMPVKENDFDRICSILAYQKKCYRIIAAVVAVIGMSILPVIPKLVGEVSLTDNLYVIYLLFLLDSVSSYILSYKQSIFIASQKNYVITLATLGRTILLQVSRIAVLLLTENYILYVGLSVVCMLLYNFSLYGYADTQCPYLKSKAITPLDDETKSDVKKKVRGMISLKIGGYVVFSTDNILISYFFGVVQVGLYSNYYIIINYLQQLTGQMIDSVVPSVGNLLLNEDREKNYEIYRKIRFLTSAIFMFFSLCFFGIAQRFITLWLGEEHLLPLLTVYCMALNFFQFGMRKPVAVFKNAAGVFYENRFVPIYEAVTNIVVSILLAYLIGLPGVLLGTFISTLWPLLYEYPKYVWSKVFFRKKSSYYWDLLKSFLQWHVGIAITFLAVVLKSNYMISNSFLDFILTGLMVAAACLLYLFVISRGSPEFQFYRELLQTKLRRNRSKES